jgi:hypothetical protein
VSANGWHDTLFDKQLATVETFEAGTETGGVFCKRLLVYGRSNIHRDGVDVCKAEPLKSEEQISAVQAAAKHGDNGFLAEFGNMLKAFNGSFTLR